MSALFESDGLKVCAELFEFVRDEALPGTGLDETRFWEGAAAIVADMAPRIRQLMAQRIALQEQINAYHADPTRASDDPTAQVAFLQSIGYLAEAPADFQITTDGADPELTTISGPQLVVPLSNARFAVNAANARWGSLYDALYGTDVIDEADGRARGTSYNLDRGAAVIAHAREFLDTHFPLSSGSHAEATSYFIEDSILRVQTRSTTVGLADPQQIVGYQGTGANPSTILLVHHGLHVEIQIDRDHPIGRTDVAGIKDVVLESAVTTIMDLEDSVAAVDAADKLTGYRNWLYLMQGRLTAEFTKNGTKFVRTLAPDREYTRVSGTETMTLPGRATLLVRHVGHFMSSEAVLDQSGTPVPEGILDALFTGLGSLHDLRGPTAGGNSRAGSAYVVKPKLHGPDEVELACEILARTEALLGLPPTSIKIGIMDEERRTSANLEACIHRARDRVVFINTGFLDRTGDEIHTSMLAGPLVRKAEMKSQPWFDAYEKRNVHIGLACGFRGRAQIGKGMWAAPDNMADMVADKVTHPQAGANCAWVPSPTAATLHAVHYHLVDVAERQSELAQQPRVPLTNLLTIPLGDAAEWDLTSRREELDNNVQSTLGYVVRWVDDGVGCSKVPDRQMTPLMEDRATCRISSQHVANWIRHGIISVDDVDDSLRRMAAVVDQQNAGVDGYRPMGPQLHGEAFRAARELLLQGAQQPSGYTEPILHRHRAAVKATLLEESCR